MMTTDGFVGTGVLYVKAVPPTPCIDDLDEWAEGCVCKWARDNSCNEISHNSWVNDVQASTHEGGPCIILEVCEGVESDDYGEMHASALEVTQWVQTLKDDGWTILDWEVHVEEVDE